MNTYRVRLLCNGDKQIPYELQGITATCPEAAAWKAKIQIAEWGWFPSCMSFNARLNILTTDSVEPDNK